MYSPTLPTHRHADQSNGAATAPVVGPSHHQRKPTSSRANLPSWESVRAAHVKTLFATCSNRYTAAYKLTTPAAVQAVFSPLSGCDSTGVAAVDTLLARAAAVNPFLPSGTGNGSDGEGGTYVGAGGWVSGSLNEIYGPPMSGKSFLLQRTAQAFLQKQLSLAQYEEQQQQQQWQQQQHRRCCPTDRNEPNEVAGLMRAKEASLPSRSNDMDRGEGSWDLYVCLFTFDSGIGCDRPLVGETEEERRHHPPPHAPGAATATEVAWARQLSSLVRDNDVAAAAAAASHSQAGGGGRERMARYTRDHTHFISLAHPNELLLFLTWLARKLDAMAAEDRSDTPVSAEAHAGSREAVAKHEGEKKSRGPSCRGARGSPSPTPPASQRSLASSRRARRSRRDGNAALESELCGHDGDDDSGTGVEGGKRCCCSLTPPTPPSQLTQRRRQELQRRKRLRREAGGDADDDDDGKMAASQEAEGQLPCLGTGQRSHPPHHHHHTLLLIDSLADVWAHPCLQGSQHALHWFSVELQRLLRWCLCRRHHARRELPDKDYMAVDSTKCHATTTSSSSSQAMPPPGLAITATAVVANGSSKFLNVGSFAQRQQQQQQQQQQRRFFPSSCLQGPCSSIPASVPAASSHTNNNNDQNSNGNGRGRVMFSPATTLPSAFPASTSSLDSNAKWKRDDETFYPLGDETWLSAPDLRVLLRPAEHTLLSLATRNNNRSTGGDDDGGSRQQDKEKDGSGGERFTGQHRRLRAVEGRRETSSLVFPVPVPGQPVSVAIVVKGTACDEHHNPSCIVSYLE